MRSSGGVLLSGEQALTLERPAICPLPYSSDIGIVDGALVPRLTVPSEIVLDTAVEVLRRHPDDATLVLFGETDYVGLPNTTDLQERRALKSPYKITKDSIVSLYTLPNGRPLNHTPRQIEALAHHFRTAGVEEQEILLIPFEFHLMRVMQIARMHALRAKFVAAEDVLQAAGVTKYDAQLSCLAELEKFERVKRIASFIDRKNILADSMMRTVGPNILNIVPDGDGGHKVIEEAPRAKRKALQAQL